MSLATILRTAVLLAAVVLAPCQASQAKPPVEPAVVIAEGDVPPAISLKDSTGRAVEL